MNKTLKLVIAFFIGFVLVKAILSYFVPAPSAFSDEYYYAKLARSFFYNQEFSVHGIFANQYPPLYPILLSITYIFSDMTVIYAFMKIINAIVSSAIIFPAFFLAKEFLNEKKSLIIALLVSLIPSSFAFSPYIMSENLFYPLFLLSVYFLYKAFKENNNKWNILAGIAVGLTYLTKVIGIVLVGSMLVILAIKFYKKEKLNLLAPIFALLTVLPWIIKNIIYYGFSISGIIGTNYALEYSHISTVNVFFSFITWVILYLGVIALSSGIIPFTLGLNKENKLLSYLLFSISALIILIAANHNSHVAIGSTNSLLSWIGGRPLSRYTDIVLPLLFISAFLGIKKEIPRRSLFISLILLLVSSQLVFFTLFPVNNLSLSWLGSLTYLIQMITTDKLLISVILVLLFSAGIGLLCFLRDKNKLTTKTISFLLLLFFIGSSLINYPIIYYNSNEYWCKGDQMQLGLGLNDPGKTVLFDERDQGKIWKTNQTMIYEKLGGEATSTIMGFWMNDDIKIGNINNLKGVDYVVSRHKLNLELLKETKNGIYLYKV